MNIGKQLFYSGSCLFELARGLILVIIGLAFIHFFIATVFIVDGISMEPNFHSGQIIVVNRISYMLGHPKRGDAVVIRFPGDPEHKKFIKRIVALPGETVDLANNKLLINGVPEQTSYLPPGTETPVMIAGKTHWQLAANEYFLCGDNRPNSDDSRTWDQANQHFLIGKAVFVLWPPKDIGLVPNVSL